MYFFLASLSMLSRVQLQVHGLKFKQRSVNVAFHGSVESIIQGCCMGNWEETVLKV